MQGIVSGLRKQSVVFLLFSLVFTFTGMSLMGCGGSSSKPLGVTVTASSSTVDGADKITVTATVANDKAAAGVTWAMTGAGALSNTSTSGATYTAPAPTASSQSATITATSVADATKTASVTITIPAAPAITTAALSPGSVGSVYSQSLVATGGIAPYTWKLTSGTLPSCLSIVTSGSSTTLTGTPTPACAGTYNNLIFTVTDSGTPTALTATTVSLSITIAPAPAILFGAPTLPAGTLNSSYTGSVAATGGAGTLTYSLASGSSLPAGLSLSTAGAITGKPTAVGTKTFSVAAADAFGDSAQQNGDSITINYPALNVTSATLPSGYVGSSYSQTLAATGGSGFPYSWSLSGGTTLPAGLSLSSGGAITGKPTATGTTNFTAKVTDSAGNTATGNFAIAVNAGVSFTTGTTLPSAYVGSNYSQTVAATGGSGLGYTYALSSGSTLPAGLSLTSAGVLSGKPTATGNPTFGITATDSVGNTASATFTLPILAGITITVPTLPMGYNGAAYPSTTVSATGGSGAGYTWSWAAASGSSLPGGLTFTNGIIAGTASNTGTTSTVSSVVISVTDGAGNTATANASITIEASVAISTGATLPGATINAAYSQTLAATGGAGGYSWTTNSAGTSSLAAINLTLASSGLVSGTPTSAGTASFAATVTDSQSHAATVTFTVTATNALTVTTTTLPLGYTNTAYSQTLGAAGGSGTGYTWTTTGTSNLATYNLTLSSAGVVSGTPTTAGTASFSAKVTDSLGATATQALSVVVDAPLVISTSTTLPTGYNGTHYSQSLAATGGSGSGYSWALANSTTLPAGLTLSGSTISGTPTATGTASFSLKVTDSVGGSKTSSFSITVNAGVSITTGTTLPAGYVGNGSYSQQLAASGGSGTGYAWTLNSGSNLPAGLSLSTGGLITGNPTTANSYSFSIKATDSVGNSANASFSLTIGTGISITQPSLPIGYPGTPYTPINLGYSGGSGAGIQWSWVAAPGSTLPSGLSLSTAGQISGTPANATNASVVSNVVITVKDSAGNTANTTTSITIEATLAISTGATLPGATINAAYSHSLAATGGSNGYSWATNSAGTSSLAAINLTLNSSGLVSGTPLSSGTATFAATVTDSQSHTATVTFTVTASNALTITTGSLPNGYSGKSYSQTLTAAGGSGTGYTWTTTGTNNLASFNLTLSTAGLLSGTPASTGTVSFTAKVTDSLSNTATQSYSFAIGAALSLPAASPNPWPSGTVNQSYSASISASGGSGSGYTWYVNGSQVSGAGVALADNLNVSVNGLNQLTVTGTPNAIQSVSIPNVSVTDSLGNSFGTITYTIQINSAGSQITGQIFINSCNLATYPTFTVKLMQGSTVVQTTSTDGSGNYTFSGVQNGTYSVVPSISGPSSVFYPASIPNLVVSNGNLNGETFSATLGVTVSGNISYAGTNTGEVYVELNNSNCGGNSPNGTSITEAQLTAGGAFTLRGVPPGNYTFQGGMDMFGHVAENSLDPSFPTTTLTVGTTDVTNVALTLLDSTVVTPTAGPKLSAISPTNLGVVINYGAITDSTGTETVSGYTVQWSTGTSFTSPSSYAFVANGKKAPIGILHNGLANMTGSFSNGTVYYFRARGELPGGIHTPWTYYGSQTTPTPVTVGALAASASTWNIPGAVTIPSTVTVNSSAPLYVGFFNQSTGQAYATLISTPSNVSANAFSFNVPNTSTPYFFFAILDQNNDGLIDAGDVSNTEDNNNSSTTPTGNLINQNVTLPAVNSTASVTTSFYTQNNQYGTSTGYGVNFNVRGANKQPVAVALTAASNPNVVIPVDIGVCLSSCGNPQYQYNFSLGNVAPVVGNSYTFAVTYSDGSTGTVTGMVTAVLTAANAPSNLAPTGSSSSSTTPTFTWTYPANASSYTYQFYMNDSNGNTIWQIPGNNSNLNGFPSTVTDIVWGTDPTGDSSNTPSVPSLTTGTTYNWQLQAQDANGNSAQTQVYYIP